MRAGCRVGRSVCHTAFRRHSPPFAAFRRDTAVATVAGLLDCWGQGLRLLVVAVAVAVAVLLQPLVHAPLGGLDRASAPSSNHRPEGQSSC